MKLVWTSFAVVVALLLQSALSRIAPGPARVLDLFLLVPVYCGLTGGEVHGMLAGAAAGWVQDVHFGGRVVGLSGLTKLLVGFGVGAASTRFLLQGPLSRMLVLFVATLADGALFVLVSGALDLRSDTLSPLAQLSRAAVNALVGTCVFELGAWRSSAERVRP